MASKTPSTSKPGDSERIFRALADATRQRIVQLLLAEELSVTELVEILRQPQSTISRHLKSLRSAALVLDRRDGATSYYRVHSVEDQGNALTPLLMNWFATSPLSTTLRDRLQRVLADRRGGTGSFFDRLGRKWDELRAAAFGDAFALEAMLSLLPAEWTVADIGTGTGFLLPTLADNFRNVIAVEPAATMLECARQRVADHGAANVTFHQGDLNRLPIQDSTADLAIACLVLHHVEKPADALAEIHRVVRPGGRVLLIEQQSHENQSFYETMQDLWWGFEPDDLASQVNRAGFANVHHRRLASAERESRTMEAPRLFMVTGAKVK
ncbi:MAG: metalloregulator ArsR/SmtB family transcription factor [Planctomycetes bacterium]|nr:metalloregulator ArsR/SmtB family transcription factor [Planctomycetota bacterium]